MYEPFKLKPPLKDPTLGSLTDFTPQTLKHDVHLDLKLIKLNFQDTGENSPSEGTRPHEREVETGNDY